jgi:predicted  nucleic acid-binding Zn-ribbon protein
VDEESHLKYLGKLLQKLERELTDVERKIGDLELEKEELTDSINATEDSIDELVMLLETRAEEKEFDILETDVDDLLKGG